MQPQAWITLKAPAKINLYLKVTGRRADGYHTLETLMQKVSLCDELALRARERGVLLHCPGDMLPEDNNNLVYRAAELFLKTMEGRRAGSIPGVEISLKKNIPIAAGLGGGSSDAAATLMGLNRLFSCSCSDEELAALGLQLGADVPFFLANTSAALATGIGELLTPVASLTDYSILLINPGFPVSTQWVYQTFALTNNGNTSNLKNSQNENKGADISGATPGNRIHPVTMSNDLERVTASRYPEIELLKNELMAQGATVALMSGSGPTVFGLFADQQSAEASQAVFRRRFEHAYLVSPFGGNE